MLLYVVICCYSLKCVIVCRGPRHLMCHYVMQSGSWNSPLYLLESESLYIHSTSLHNIHNLYTSEADRHTQEPFRNLLPTALESSLATLLRIKISPVSHSWMQHDTTRINKSYNISWAIHGICLRSINIYIYIYKYTIDYRLDLYILFELARVKNEKG